MFSPISCLKDKNAGFRLPGAGAIGVAYRAGLPSSSSSVSSSPLALRRSAIEDRGLEEALVDNPKDKL